jgi:excisionase family DNA binding protein
MSGLAFTLPAELLDALAERVATRLASDGRLARRTSYLTADEAAEYLGFRVKRIYNLTSRGEIPHRKQDGRLLFKRDELDAWMDQFYVGPDWLDLAPEGPMMGRVLKKRPGDARTPRGTAPGGES